MKKYNKSKNISAKGIQVVEPNVAGIDIGAKEIYVACPDSKGEIPVNIFGTTTPELRKIAELLKALNITSAAMEATGVYWIPLFEVLEDHKIKAVLVDPKSVKSITGKKTDVLDCQWIQRLHSCGLLRSAFRPPKDREAVRAYLRHRSNLIQDRQTTVLRMQKALLFMNIKLDVAVSDIMSVTGFSIIKAIISGERDPKKLAALRNYRCKKDEEVFIDALTGNFQEPHLFSLKQALDLFEIYNIKIDDCDKMLQKELEKWPTITNDALPKSEKHAKYKEYKTLKKPIKNEFNFDMREILHRKTGHDLTAYPGISEIIAATITSELGGTEMSAFLTEKHWCSWLGLCPGNNVTGGKSHGGRNKKCKNRIKQALCMAAFSLHHSKSALGAFYRRLHSRLGAPKAIKAVAHKLARFIYRAFKYGKAYVEAGQAAYEKKYEEKRKANLKKNAKELGFELVVIK